MKQIELKYTQLIGKALSYNVLAVIRAQSFNKKDSTEDFERKCRKGYKKIGSKRLYGSTLLVDRLMSY